MNVLYFFLFLLFGFFFVITFLFIVFLGFGCVISVSERLRTVWYI